MSKKYCPNNSLVHAFSLDFYHKTNILINFKSANSIFYYKKALKGNKIFRVYLFTLAHISSYVRRRRKHKRFVVFRQEFFDKLVYLFAFLNLFDNQTAHERKMFY